MNTNFVRDLVTWRPGFFGDAELALATAQCHAVTWPTQHVTVGT